MDIPRITPEELKAKVDRGEPVLILDVRKAPDGGKIRGALHVPLAEIETGAASLPRDREIVAYCR
jgi:rhodanese-related sulfurtransferase